VRDHRQWLAIVVLDLLLGWTLVGWVAALVWACTADTKPAAMPPSAKAKPNFAQAFPPQPTPQPRNLKEFLQMVGRVD
jgi:hypothetical protein